MLIRMFKVIISCVPTYGPYVRALAINISSNNRSRRQTYDVSGYGRSGRSGAGQSYNLSSRNMKSGGSRVFDNSVSATGIVGSPSVRGKNSSTESILADRDAMDTFEHGHEHGQEGKRKKGIHIATEVRVERGPRGEDE